jgi:hypothetical protein
LPESSTFTLVDTLHAFTFFAIFMTLVVSAIALKYHDSGRTEAALRVNRIGSRIVVVSYIFANLIAVVLALR